LIERIEIKNFQAHRRLAVNFGDNVTSIIGPSDTGKSTILRALRWVCLNQPMGTAFLRHGTKEASVSITIDGTVLTRAIKNGTNTYHLGDRTYAAFGRDVPEPIVNFLRVAGLNFQGQHDAPFWLSESAGAVSRELNRIVDLDLIDSSLSKLDAMLRKARTVQETRSADLAKAKEARRRLAFVPSLQKQFSQIEQLHTDSQQSAQQAQALQKLYQEGSALEDTIQTLQERLDDANAVAQLGSQAADATKKHCQLARLIQSAEQADRYANIALPSTTRLQGLADKAASTVDQAEQLETLLVKMSYLSAIITEREDDVARLLTKIKTVTKGRCPVCGQPLPQNQMT